MTLAVLMPGFEGTTLPAWLDVRLRDGLGGVCLFSDNVESPEQLRALTSAIYAANPRAVISMDEEGGDVTRLYHAVGSPFPGNAILGRMADAVLTERVGRQVGLELAAAGVGLALAPDADVNSNPANPVIGVRSFGADAELVAEHVAAWTRGLEATGVAACAKHFPGHGDTAQDSHLALPVVDADADTLRARDLAPFRAAIAAGTRTIMTSHILVPAFDAHQPATFSQPILTGVLRGELGFEGVIVTDALDMAGASGTIGIPAAAVAALTAGADLLCIGTRNTDEQIGEIVAAIDAAVAAGSLPSATVATAVARVHKLGEAIARLESPLESSGAVAGVDVARVASTFRVTASARSALDERTQPVAWVAYETTPNIAVGHSPWGPFAAGVEPFAVVTAPEQTAHVLQSVPTDHLAVVVGKDLGRHPRLQSAVAAAREQRPVLVVDMGWPWREADIATFGASRIAGESLLHLVGE